MNLEVLAQEIYEAYKEKKALEKVSGRYEGLNEKMAYQVQQMVTELKINRNNEKLTGYKISMTSEKTQKMGNSNSPTYGTFTSESMVTNELSLDERIYLIEPELVFIFKDDLSPRANHQEIIEKSMIAAGLEIPTSRYANWFPPKGDGTVIDNIVDNAVAGYMLIGEPIEILDSIDWENIHATLYHNDEVIDRGVSSEVLGNPLNSVEWLSDKLAQSNRTLHKGEFVSAGTFTMPHIVESGTYKVVFDVVGELTLKINR